MDIASCVFYLCAALLVLSALMVISARNPVHSVLFLIFCFFNAAGLFVLIGAEYIAMTLVIVYVGAVAVLFLFVVMMIDIDIATLRQGFLRYLPLGGIAALLLLGQFGLLFSVVSDKTAQVAKAASPIPADKAISNTEAIGRVLYTDYVYPFQMAGLVLLVAMIGAIVLTLRNRKQALRQNIGQQVSRSRADAIELVTVKSGEGA
jgi:NADH-quinone oxidoreductase subunit J